MNKIFNGLVLISALFMGSLWADEQEAFEIRVQGKGYLQIILRDGSSAYARNLYLKPSDYGQMVNEDGLALSPAITVNTLATIRRIESDGVVASIVPPHKEWIVEGQISLFSFENPAGLKPLGAGLYRETKASGAPEHGIPGNGGLGLIRMTP